MSATTLLSEIICAPGGQNVNSNKSVTNYYYYYYYYYYRVTLQNLSIDVYFRHSIKFVPTPKKIWNLN